MERHVYRPPKGSMISRTIIAVLGGLFCAFLVFFAIPILKKLEASLKPEVEEFQEENVSTPQVDEFVAEEETPPEEPEEPEPELQEESQDLDLSIDLPDLSGGVGSKVIEIAPQFQIADGFADAFDTSELQQPPKASTRFPPRYPDKLKKKKIQGRVLVSAVINESGQVTEAKVKESSGHPEMDKAAVKAINKWKFKPGIRKGKKVKAKIIQPISFKLSNA